jgi:uncharacterized protein (DUF1697 family)
VPTYIALLRGINLGKHNRIPMGKLQQAFEGLGFEQVRTYIQSGNVIFNAGTASNLCQKIEEKIRSDFGLAVSVISKTAEELGDAIRNNPFLKKGGVDHSRLHVTFLSSVPAAAAEKLDRLRAGPDQFCCAGLEVYLYCRDGYGRTKLSNAAIEKALSVRATTRNWRTVNQLYQMALEQGRPAVSKKARDGRRRAAPAR